MRRIFLMCLGVMAMVSACPSNECESGFDCDPGESCVLSDEGNRCEVLGGDGDGDDPPTVELALFFGEETLPVITGEAVATDGTMLRAEVTVSGPVVDGSCRLFVAGVEAGIVDNDSGLEFAAVEGTVRASCQDDEGVTVQDDIVLLTARIDDVTVSDEAYLVGETIEVAFTGENLGPCTIEGGDIVSSVPAGGTGVVNAGDEPNGERVVSVSCEGPTGFTPPGSVTVPVWDLTGALQLSDTDVEFGTPITVSWSVPNAEFCALADDIGGQYLLPNLPGLGTTLNEIVDYELVLPYSMQLVLLCRQGQTIKQGDVTQVMSRPFFDALTISHRVVGDDPPALQVAFETRGMYPDSCDIMRDDEVELATGLFNNTGNTLRGPFFGGEPISLPPDTLSRVYLRCVDGLFYVESDPVFVFAGDRTSPPAPPEPGPLVITGTLALDPLLTALPAGFDALVEVGGDLILDDTALSDTLVDAAPPVLEQVVGNVDITNNATLAALTLPTLRTVFGSLNLSRNSALVLADLATLDRVGVDLYLFENAWTATSFPLLSIIGQDLFLDGDDGRAVFVDALQTADFPTLVQVGRDIQVLSRGGLTAINLPLLETVGRDLFLFAVTNLPTFAAPELRTTGGFLGGAILQSTTGFDLPQLESVSGLLLFLNEVLGEGGVTLRDMMPCLEAIDPIMPPPGEMSPDMVVGTNPLLDCPSTIAFACGMTPVPTTLTIQDNGGACPDEVNETNVDCTTIAPPVCGT